MLLITFGPLQSPWLNELRLPLIKYKKISFPPLPLLITWAPLSASNDDITSSQQTQPQIQSNSSLVKEDIDPTRPLSPPKISRSSSQFHHSTTTTVTPLAQQKQHTRPLSSPKKLTATVLEKDCGPALVVEQQQQQQHVEQRRDANDNDKDENKEDNFAVMITDPKLTPEQVSQLMEMKCRQVETCAEKKARHAHMHRLSKKRTLAQSIDECLADHANIHEKATGLRLAFEHEAAIWHDKVKSVAYDGLIHRALNETSASVASTSSSGMNVSFTAIEDILADEPMTEFQYDLGEVDADAWNNSGSGSSSASGTGSGLSMLASASAFSVTVPVNLSSELLTETSAFFEPSSKRMKKFMSPIPVPVDANPTNASV